jgi:hypothetical protein
LLVVRNDGSRDVWRCSNHRQSRCRPCATRYRRRVQSLASNGINRRDGFYYLLTLTAPSDVHYYGRSGAECPCSVRGFDLSRWNPGAGKSWNHLLTAIERAYGHRPAYFRAAEVQQRGALHHHVIVWSPVALDTKTLRPLVIAAGYGHELKLDPLDPGARKAARYVAKYVTKSCDTRESVPWHGNIIDKSTGELTEGPTAATFRTWSQSQNYGTTMRVIRQAAQDKAAELEWIRRLSTRWTSTPAELADETPPSPS